MKNQRNQARYLFSLILALIGFSIWTTLPFHSAVQAAHADNRARDIKHAAETASKLAANGKIAFTSNESGNREIYLMNSDGTEKVRLTSNPGADDFPAWSPDGLRLAFLSQNAAGSYVIKLMNADGTSQKELTPVRFNGNFDPYEGPRWAMSWSPDGTKIAFDNEGISIINVDGTNLVNLSTGSHPSWSPDGSRIAFCTPSAGTYYAFRLHTMNADGSNQVEIPGAINGNYTQDVDPAWSPDGKKVAGVQQWFIDVGVMFIRDLSGNVVFSDWTSARDSSSPTWAPDGTKVAYSAVVSPYVQYSNVEIFVVDVGGSGVKQLTNTGGYDAHPAWQPLAPSACPNPIDCAEFFVRQQYLDFLNREPDADGLAFWTNEIMSCGGDPQCIEVKRINVSAAYFLSIEFQQTGYLVYRIYKASYGNLPDAAVPIKLNEYLPDTQKIGQGVIVNQSGWEQTLENNMQNFTAEFVQRARFTSACPMSMSPDEFVDRLYMNAVVMPSATDRANAINEFNGALDTSDMAARARALRRVAEDPVLAQQEFNRAFVLMQYFGYLRRDPNQGPDTDFAGYSFWLNKLDTFNGNYIEAEMVRAFITSTEYRKRFGQ